MSPGFDGLHYAEIWFGGSLLSSVAESNETAIDRAGVVVIHLGGLETVAGAVVDGYD